MDPFGLNISDKKKVKAMKKVRKQLSALPNTTCSGKAECCNAGCPNMTYADENGRETVPMWSCEPGCPVASMDAQTGVLTSGSGTVKRSSGRERKGNRGAAYGAENRPDGTPMIFYGDTGGASRFSSSSVGITASRPSLARGHVRDSFRGFRVERT